MTLDDLYVAHPGAYRIDVRSQLRASYPSARWIRYRDHEELILDAQENLLASRDMGQPSACRIGEPSPWPLWPQPDEE